jgi:hypothetical protein
MRGDVRIVDGKLCYAFEVSDAWLAKLNEKTRFFKEGIEWKVKSIESGIAWCYLINPLKVNDQRIIQLEEKLSTLEKHIDAEIEMQNRKFLDAEHRRALPWTTKAKIYINKLTYKLFKRKIFEIPCHIEWLYSPPFY